MDQRIIDLYDEFTHGDMERRAFLGQLAKLTGGMSAAFMLLPRLENDYGRPGVVSPADASIQTEYVRYSGASGDILAYRATPTGAGPFPGVIIIHENRGLNPHIEDVARRAATAGFWAIAPDALSPLGGTPEDQDEARTKMRQLDANQTVRDYGAAVGFVKNHSATNGRVGCVGFCWGGGMANQLAVHSPDLNAAVAFYGRQAAAEQVTRIKAALLLHYAGLDTRINEGITEFETALKAVGVRYQLHMYDNVNHAFHNDTSPTRYNERAARLAWERTVSFFRAELSG